MAGSQGSSTVCERCGSKQFVLNYKIDCGSGVVVEVHLSLGDQRLVGVGIQIDGQDMTEKLSHIAVALTATIDNEVAAMLSAGQAPESVPQQVVQLTAGLAREAGL